MESKEIEIWKDLPGTDGQYSYAVSNFGNVKSIHRVRTISINGTVNGNGYRMFHIRLNKKSRVIGIHTLVAMLFIPNTRGMNQINHIDGNKLNNHVNNLEWCNHSENHLHAYRIGLRKATCAKMVLHTQMGLFIHSISEAAIAFNVKHWTLRESLKKNDNKFNLILV